METGNIEKKLNEVTTLLKAVANEKRLLILCTLLNGEKNVGELQAIIGLSQSALSQHLSKLRHDGLVITRRDAQAVYYNIVDGDARKLIGFLCDLTCPNAQ